MLLHSASPRGWSAGTNRGILVAMAWHKTLKDDAWKQAHLAMLVTIRRELSLTCDGCQHWRKVAPQAFAAQHGLDMLTPLLTNRQGAQV